MWLDFLNVPFPKPLTFQFCYSTLINKKVINKYVSAKTFEKDYIVRSELYETGQLLKNYVRVG